VNPELWSRTELVALLGLLADRLARRGVSASVYVVGGAAISLAFDSRRATRDIDAMVLEGHGPLIEEVRSIARERGLPSTWLNEQAVAYVSTVGDGAATVVFDHPNLRVAAASAEHLLAMKVAAARPTDVADIVLLAGNLGIGSAAEAMEVYRRVFPGQDLGDRQRLVVEDALG